MQHIKYIRSTFFRSLIITKSNISEPRILSRKTLDGVPISEEKLQLRVADADKSIHLVHRYIKMFQQNKRQGSSNTKTRSEVRGGGKKPYTQKKTGNARRGTNRSPLRPGGGVLFGPKPRDWTINMSKKERRLAMATAIQNSSEIMTVIDTFELSEIKTQSIVKALQNLNVDPMKEKTLLIATKPNQHLTLSTRNVKMLTLRNLRSVNIFDILTANKILMDKYAL
jgi:large subunit ribosomal protein L4